MIFNFANLMMLLCEDKKNTPLHIYRMTIVAWAVLRNQDE